MRLSTALFASIVAICCTVGIVNSQIMFADGSVQTTAFDGSVSVPSGKAFSFSKRFDSQVDQSQSVSPVVPSGQELVILKIISPSTGNSGNMFKLESYVSDQDTILLTFYEISEYTNPNPLTYDYPDGTIVVDEGRTLFIRNLWYPDSNYLEGTITILGYYRDK